MATKLLIQHNQGVIIYRKDISNSDLSRFEQLGGIIELDLTSQNMMRNKFAKNYPYMRSCIDEYISYCNQITDCLPYKKEKYGRVSIDLSKLNMNLNVYTTAELYVLCNFLQLSLKKNSSRDDLIQGLVEIGIPCNVTIHNQQMTLKQQNNSSLNSMTEDLQRYRAQIINKYRVYPDHIFDTFTVSKLKDLCRNLKLKVSGHKFELQTRIYEALMKEFGQAE
jgi:hypothetical protein